MRTERNSSERRKPMSYLSRSKNSALIPQSSVLCIALCALLFALCCFAEAQQQAKVPKIGFLGARPTPASGQELWQELRKLGYVEGKNIAIDYRYADNKIDRLPALADELVRLKVDLLITPGTNEALAAKNATRTIPIVFVNVGDPVAAGLVDSLSRPGGNITGVSNIAGDLSAKLMQLLSQAAPNMKRVAVLRNPANALATHQMKDVEPAARSLGLQLEVFDVRGPADFETAYAGIAKAHVGGVVLLADALFTGYSKQLAELAIKSRIPSIYVVRTYPESGGLTSYGPGLDIFRLAATFVDKILKGAKPADLPIEQPTRLEFIINGRTAKALGLTLPQSLLISADKVIE